MSKTAIISGLALAVGLGAAGLGGFAFYTAKMNEPAKAATGSVTAVDLANVGGYAPVEGDVVVPLTHELEGGNTHVVWHCGKTLAGVRHDFVGTWGQLSGAVAYTPGTGELKAVQVNLLVESIVGYGAGEHRAPGGMTNTLLGKGVPTDPWFSWEQYPDAVFIATEFVPAAEAGEVAGAPEGWTHLIKGSFTLNSDQAKDLAIPAVVSVSEEGVSIDLAFTLSRKDYGVDGAGAGPVDDEVQIEARVEAKPDAGDAMANIAALIQANANTISEQANAIKQLNERLAVLTETLAGLDSKIASGLAAGPAQPAVDVSNLPKTFADKVVYPNKEIPFGMVLVPGDASSGIAPFYMAEKEVTWDMFNDWAYSTDIGPDLSAELQKKDLRPSPLYEDCEQLKFGKGERPAISMSRTTAQAYAKWLSEQTGRNYRLPTDAEWQLALKLGGGIPSDEDALLKQAYLNENAEKLGDVNDPFFDPTDPNVPTMTSFVGKTEPNALGIYDLLGNAAEWVVDTGTERIVRGGHFRLPASEVSADWKAIEDQDVWNATYPQKPNSRFWYRDHFYQGIRLVCDPVNLPQ